MRKFVHDERRLQFSLVLAVLLLVGAISARAYLTNRTSAKLCNVLYSVVARSGATVGKPGTPGYAYYHVHPRELREAHKQNQQFLHELPCKGR